MIFFSLYLSSLLWIHETDWQWQCLSLAHVQKWPFVNRFEFLPDITGGSFFPSSTPQFFFPLNFIRNTLDIYVNWTKNFHKLVLLIERLFSECQEHETSAPMLKHYLMSLHYKFWSPTLCVLGGRPCIRLLSKKCFNLTISSECLNKGEIPRKRCKPLITLLLYHNLSSKVFLKILSMFCFIKF